MRILFILVAMIAATVVRASDLVVEARDPFVNRGVSITKYVDGASITWTNDVTEPWFPVSVLANNGTATNIITIEVIRLYGMEYQTTPDAVVTNFMGGVETNVSRQVTNVVTRSFTGTVAQVSTVANTARPVYVTGGAGIWIAVEFMFKANDIIKITQSDTNAKAVVISGRR